VEEEFGGHEVPAVTEIVQLRERLAGSLTNPTRKIRTVEFFAWLEQTGIATWVREAPSLWAYPTILTLHTAGLAFLVGLSAAIDLRILGFAQRVPLAPMEKFYPIMWTAFWVNAISGFLLFIADASFKMTQTVFFIKMIFVGLAVAIMYLMRSRVFRDPALDKKPLPQNSKMLAATSLFFWTAAIIAGRLMAYIR
jgi:hypothetical protein